ncbi:P2X purinoceptor 4-like [Watersipora subatra]|uniref:P2X purinoceptor 4-like n=1 Tax=Watersipora subatra TaxID=2589382 RepID=UPI00355BDD3C
MASYYAPVDVVVAFIYILTIVIPTIIYEIVQSVFDWKKAYRSSRWERWHRDRYERLEDDEEKVELLNKSKVFVIVYWIVVALFVILPFTAVALGTNSLHEKAQADVGTTINIAGLAKTRINFAAKRFINKPAAWDPTDIAHPAAENNVFFLTTKRVRTGPQTISDCTDCRKPCRSENDCEADITSGNPEDPDGISTGNCLNGFCEVKGWCPHELDEEDSEAATEVLDGHLHFTLFIKSHISFTYDGENKTKSYNNIDGQLYTDKGAKCKYDTEQNKHCPFFRITDILDISTDNNGYEKLIKYGGVVSIRLQYYCNTNKDEETCLPEYHFNQLTTKNMDDNGYNFTDASYSYENKSMRDLTRSTGILFIVTVQAYGFKISPINVIIVSASLLIMLKSAKSLARLIVDIIFWCRHCYNKRGRPKQRDDVVVDDAEMDEDENAESQALLDSGSTSSTDI